MPQVVSDLVDVFEKLWPVALSEEWDRPGLVSGSPNQTITKVLLAVDLTEKVVEEAISKEAQLILLHHPPLLKGVHYLSSDTLKGSLFEKLTQSSLATFAAHTNADVAVNGVSATLADVLKLKDTKPLVEIAPGIGHGRIGTLITPMTLEDLANAVHSLLPKTKAPIRVAGDLKAKISKVAVVGGAGDSFLDASVQSGADCFITSDLRHHLALDYSSGPKGINLIDISHFAGESLWLATASKQLLSFFPSIEFIQSEISSDPWSLTIAGN